MAFFGISDLTTIKRMPIDEFELRLHAHNIIALEDEKNRYQQAYLNREAKAMTRDGKSYAFKSFDKFYDYDKRRRDVLGGFYGKPVNSRLIEIARKMKDYKGGE